MDFKERFTASKKDIKFVTEDVSETETANSLWAIDIENTIVDLEDRYRRNNSRI